MSDQYDGWRFAVRKAWAGEPRLLLERLLRGTRTDNAGNPLEFMPLPDDAEMRQHIVAVLMLGPWRGAADLQHLMTRTGWGRGKPVLSEYEVSGAILHAAVGGDAEALRSHAEALGVQPETLTKRMRKSRKR